MDNENISGAVEELSIETTEDAAQSAEVSAAEILNGMINGETVENDGDDAQPEENAAQDRQEEKKGNQIKAALASQRKQIFADLGMSEDEVRELVRNKRAEQMAENDPDISVKAARRIIDAEAGRPSGDQVKAYKEGFQNLMDDGYTAEELKALASDSDFVEAINAGKTFRQAARIATSKPRTEQQPRKKGAVPVSRSVSSSAADMQTDDGSYIEDMDDAAFRKFSERAHRAALRGEKVRM